MEQFKRVASEAMQRIQSTIGSIFVVLTNPARQRQLPFELTIAGLPILHQSRNRAKRTAWQQSVRAAASAKMGLARAMSSGAQDHGDLLSRGTDFPDG
jgi:hypothetical protein